jgi:hypothetical protein
LTVKLDALFPEPWAVVTETVPVVPLPITATICVAVLEVMEDTAVPPIVTEVAELRYVPLMVMLPPEQPLAEPRLDITGGTLQLIVILSTAGFERGLDPFSSAVNTNRIVVPA